MIIELGSASTGENELEIIRVMVNKEYSSDELGGRSDGKRWISEDEVTIYCSDDTRIILTGKEARLINGVIYDGIVGQKR